MEFLKTALKGVNKCFLSNYHRVLFTAQTTRPGKKVTQKLRKNLSLKKKKRILLNGHVSDLSLSIVFSVW